MDHTLGITGSAMLERGCAGEAAAAPERAARAEHGTLAETSLRVEGISKRFGGLRVFDDISFELPAGEVLGVIGPNGAGKTTLINVICSMLRPSAGRVLLGGKELSRLPFHTVSRLGVIRSFQQTNTFRTASVAENLARACRFSAAAGRGTSDLDGLLEEFGLTPHLEEPSGDLPYGLQKMLGLLMTLATRPRFLLLDEPAAGLERRERIYIDSFIAHARASLGCGVLIVEHDMDLIKRLCPHILVLEAGRLLASGAPADVLARRDVVDAYLGAGEES
ncbi:Molybdate-transporting ATPase [Delftia sp. Cs1-4]|uniref:ABC transporter ATP-binding protein n=1 Tax=Delftia sp. (strain Cs1-4) TaxID=742013 RepID=UPI00020E7D21|nr:ABC transporter ATP-binding protein [Delftia sp. Cs1-4]AEF88665.1 Molybdate-transporting ATPase [Delftia sp. Cs1-4]